MTRPVLVSLCIACILLGGLGTLLVSSLIGPGESWLGIHIERLLWFAFSDHSEAIPFLPADGNTWDEDVAKGVIFSSAASLAFMAFVVIDTLIALLAKLKDTAPADSSSEPATSSGVPFRKALAIIAVGGIASWMVAFFTVLIGVKFDIVAALGVGVSWQVAYTNLVAQLNPADSNTNTTTSPATPTSEAEMQPLLEEEEADDELEEEELDEEQDEAETPSDPASNRRDGD